jgi:hypothetical protein
VGNSARPGGSRNWKKECDFLRRKGSIEEVFLRMEREEGGRPLCGSRAGVVSGGTWAGFNRRTDTASVREPL